MRAAGVDVKLLEHEGKAVMAKHGIPIPRGTVVTAAKDLEALEYPVALKAQVLVGGRGKAGGIQLVSDVKEAAEAFERIRNLTIGGYAVRSVYAEEKLDIETELYLSVTIDRTAREPLLMASAQGGVDIEGVPDEALLKVHVPALVGMQGYMKRALAKQLGLPKETAKKVAGVAAKVYAMFRAEDAELVEINPLVVLKDGRVIAADAKVTIEDNALYRHEAYQGLEQDLTPLEKEAKAKGITFIQLPGDIGVIANGAGLTMATLDVLNLKGGNGGTFLDLGGTDDPKQVQEAFHILVKAKPSVILLNIFGGITKCDTVALGVKAAMEGETVQVPVVARIKGLNEEEAKRILRDAGMHPAESMEEAAELAVSLRGGSA
jgi:succinyl-CoA synthetase beta subunit